MAIPKSRIAYRATSGRLSGGHRASHGQHPDRQPGPRQRPPVDPDKVQRMLAIAEADGWQPPPEDPTCPHCGRHNRDLRRHRTRPDDPTAPWCKPMDGDHR